MKVFAKTDRFFVREYEEETNLRVATFYSMRVDQWPTVAKVKMVGASWLMDQDLLLVWLIYALRQTDSVGLTTFDTKVRSLVPPRGGASHTRQIIDLLGTTQAGEETWDLGKVFHEIAPPAKETRPSCDCLRLLWGHSLDP